MSAEQTRRNANDLDDAAFVARVAEAYEPPPMTPARRARFDSRLAERVRRDRLRFVPWLAAGAAAAAAALFVLSHTGPPPAAPALIAEAPGTGSGVILAEALGTTAADFEDNLPPEYQAIASLLSDW